MLKSRWSKVLGILPLVGALAGFAGCNNPQASTDEANGEAAAELQNAPQRGPMGEHGPMGERGHRPHGGPAMLLGAALHELTLTDAQKTTIQAELDALKPSADAKPDFEAHRKAVADAVRSGKIDEAALLAQMPKPPFDPARVAKAIGVLHDTLTAEQRKELVEKISARMEKMGDRGGRFGHGPDGDADRPEMKGDRGWNGEMRGPLGHLFKGVDLTDAQKETLRAAMEANRPSDADREAMKAKHDAMKAAMKEKLATFASDQFDATAFATPPADAPKMGPEAMFGHKIKVLAAIVPALNETQRAALAKNIEEAPMGPPHMGKGHHGPADDEAE